jgi:hypothetical protein
LPLPTGAATEATLSAHSAKLPAASAGADGVTNPTTTQIAAGNYLFNGTTWDRARGNWETFTGDTGAKTVTVAGATQTNYNARGAFIVVRVSGVSGTSPVMTISLQFSPDGGANWYGFGAASGTLTAVGQLAIMIYPTNISQTAGATPTNETTTAAQTLFINAPLPRTWRMVFGVGGTTPSFTITNVAVSYIN